MLLFYSIFVIYNSFFINSISGIVEHKQSCSINEEFKTCGPPCEHTCFDLIEESPCKKEDVCVKGCFCKRGFLRDRFGDCVLPRDCFPESETLGCPSSEVFDKCNGNCEVTCENYGTIMKCSRKCEPGCLCDGGLVRNEEGQCIPPEFCKKMLPDPQKCNSSLEDFHYCFAACEITCYNLDMPPDCSEKCKPGCICKEGLVRDENRDCKLPQFCSNIHEYDEGYCKGAHEVYTCGLCDTKCTTLGLPCDVFSLNCIEKCFCENGYARDHRNICIPTRKCPQSCKMSLESFLQFLDTIKRTPKPTTKHIKAKKRTW